MIDPFKAVQQLGNVAPQPFPPSSRYQGLEIAQIEREDGTVLAYVRRRFVPQPERFALLQLHTVTEGDRLDNVTATYLGDPQQFWRICDANRALAPAELVKVIGRQLRITLPDGVPGQTP